MNRLVTEVNDFNDVIYCKAEGNYTRIILQQKSLVTTKVLKCFESILPPERFLRIHKSYLVNVDYIVCLTSGNQIRLKNMEELPIARRRKARILKEIARDHLLIRSN